VEVLRKATKIVTTAYYFGFRCSLYGSHQAFYSSHVCPSVCDRVRTPKGLDGCLSELDTKVFFLIFIVVPCILITSKFFSPTNAPFYLTHKMLKRTVKISLCSYTFRSNWTILRERMLSLAKATILWKWWVKVHRYMTSGVVATSISGCDVCTACRVVCDNTQHGTQYTHHSLKYLLPQRRMSYDDVLSLINSTIL